jgi:hypothetical protein
MAAERIIYGTNEVEVWQQVDKEFTEHPDLLQYQVIINQQRRQVNLNIDIDLGGGFESGYETTTFTTRLFCEDDFRFGIYQQGFLDAAGKLFGMQDVAVGYPEFDSHAIVQANDERKVKSLLSNDFIREVILSFETDFSFAIRQHHVEHGAEKACFLELIIEQGITNTERLRKIYNAFIQTLDFIEPQTNYESSQK